MKAISDIEIDVTEQFPHLENAPIVEAVIDFRARFEKAWQQEEMQALLRVALPEYPQVVGQRGFQAKFEAGPVDLPTATTEDLGWKGLVFRSADNLQVAQFQRDGFAFSRLAPYQDWDLFSAEALRLWRVYSEVSTPVTVGRLGLRFINRIEVPASGQLEDYLTVGPRCPPNIALPFMGFFHIDTFSVPGHPYLVNLRRTVENSADAAALKTAFIIDVDVFATEGLDELSAIQKRLLDMRWLKNKIFFGSVTPEVIEGYK